MNIRTETNYLTYRMFVDTADRNYMLARVAFFYKIDVDFFWLSLHAIEKYLKAILLLNGHPAKQKGHDIIKIYDAVCKLDERMNFGSFINPNLQGLEWEDISFAKFLNKLNRYGNASNRYMVYGCDTSLNDLIKVDQVIWAIRRHCRPFILHVENEEFCTSLDMIKVLQNNPNMWSINSSLSLEKVIKNESEDGLRDLILKLNIPFSPDTEHKIISTRHTWFGSPIADHIHLVRDPTIARDIKARSAEVLRWAIQNIVFNALDEREIKENLDQYQHTKNESI